MTYSDWHTTLIAPARDDDGSATQVVCGLLRWQGEDSIALRIGSHGQAVILGEAGTRELIANLRTVIQERCVR